MRHVIIGSGVAGIAAIEAIRSVDPAAEITMVGDDPAWILFAPRACLLFKR